MPKTRLELIADVVDLLGRGPGTGQAVPPEDVAIVEKFIEPVIEQLRAKRVVAIPDPDNIEDSYYIPFSQLVANAVAPKFGIPFDAAKQRILEVEIREMMAAIPTYETMRVLYY